MVKHKERLTWEMPGGHIESDEHPEDAAIRELYEETGGIVDVLTPLYDYSVKKDVISYGRLYLADILKFETLPDFEIECVSILKDEMTWTYDQIQPILFESVLNYLETE
ncbi:MAG: NUDIX domain-containing protein [Clostridia bacterium]|nr:NUDIX domain-containing protein [Clostridia bacterium]